MEKYDTRKYNLDIHYINHKNVQEIANNDYTRGYNALFKEDINLILIQGSSTPYFCSPDIEFWPTLISRLPNDTIMLAPPEFESIYDIPENHEVYIQYNVFVEEFYSDIYYHSNGESEYPNLIPLHSSKFINEILEKNNKAVIITSFYEYLKNQKDDFKLSDYGYELNLTPFASLPLQGFTVGISRKDNPSEALKRLKIASQEFYPEQAQMFIFEHILQKELKPYYGKYFDYYYSGAFGEFDNKYRFKGFTQEKHGITTYSNWKLRETMSEAVSDMFDFIKRALRLW